MAASDPDQSSVCFAEPFKAKLPIVSLFPKPTERRGLGPFQPQGTGNLPVTTGYYCHISRGFSDRLSAWRAPMCIFYRMHIGARLFAVRKAALFFDSFPHKNFVLMGALFDLIAYGRQSLPAAYAGLPARRRSVPHKNFVLMGAPFDLIACGRQSLPAAYAGLPARRRSAVWRLPDAEHR